MHKTLLVNLRWYARHYLRAFTQAIGRKPPAPYNARRRIAPVGYTMLRRAANTGRCFGRTRSLAEGMLTVCRKPVLVPGTTRGVLTILECLPGRRLRVRCECGTERVIHAGSLYRVDHCTCQSRRVSKKPVVYTPGKRFGKLVILKHLGGQNVLCQCDCGNKTVVRTSNLAAKNGKSGTTSCGCEQLSGTGKRELFLTGQVFGDFKIVRWDRRPDGIPSHVGRCQRCGYETRRDGQRWQMNPTCTHCGSAPVGKRFGNWVVLSHEKEALGYDKGRPAYWWAMCEECGFETGVCRSNLERGMSLRCRHCWAKHLRDRSRARRMSEAAL